MTTENAQGEPIPPPEGPRRNPVLRAAVHLFFGAILPAVCVVFDPIVFKRGPTAFGYEVPYWYALIGTQIVFLVAWVLAGRWLRPLGPVFGGALAVGALFALGLGIVLLPLSLLGTLFLIGILGFTPFATAYVFFRNAAGAFRAGSGPAVRRSCAGALGVAIALGAAWAVGTWSLLGWRGLRTNAWWDRVCCRLPPAYGMRTFAAFGGRLWCIGERVWESPEADPCSWSEVDAEGEKPSKYADRAFAALGKLWVFDRSSEGSQLWSTSDGRKWTLAAPRLPWTFRGEPVLIGHREQLWALCGVPESEERERGATSSEVWASKDGADWRLVSAAVPWKGLAPELGAVIRGRMLVAEMQPMAMRGQVKTLWCSEDGIQWVSAGPAPPWSPRREFGAAVLGGTLWILGGEFVVSRDESFFLGDVWCSPDGIRWIQVSPLAPWGRRAQLTALSEGEMLWVIGGCDDTERILDDVWAFSVPPSDRAWLGMPPVELAD